MLIGVAVAGACGSTAFVPPPPSPQRVYGASEVDERPEIVQTPPLHYPEGGRQGVVVVRVVVDTAGNPEPPTALVGLGRASGLAGEGRVDRAARGLGRGRRCAPGRRAERALRVRFGMPGEVGPRTRN